MEGNGRMYYPSPSGIIPAFSQGVGVPGIIIIIIIIITVTFTTSI
jgi:hypothetical protein